MILDFEPGDKVFNPSAIEWGIGQVQSIIKEKVTVNFQNAGNLTNEVSPKRKTHFGVKIMIYKCIRHRAPARLGVRFHNNWFSFRMSFEHLWIFQSIWKILIAGPTFLQTPKLSFPQAKTSVLRSKW